MKLEFIPDGAVDTPLIRLYQLVDPELERLYAELSALASGAQGSITLHELPGIEAIDGCQLLLRVGSSDCGVKDWSLRQRSSKSRPERKPFECILTPEGWDFVAQKVESFIPATNGHYQWLHTQGDVSWLLSTNGYW